MWSSLSGKRRVLLPWIALCIFGLTAAVRAQAPSTSTTVSAQVLFERGNAQLERAQTLTGARRRVALEDALSRYAECLALARTRNVLFNTALALEQLERREQAFNIYQEYLGIADLSVEERSAASSRQNMLRPLVAVLRLQGTFPHAQIWIARRDLPALTGLPNEHAVPSGEVALWVEAEGYESWHQTLRARTGETVAVAVLLSARAIALDVLLPENTTLVVSGTSYEVTQGHVGPILLLPGEHELELRFRDTDETVHREQLSVSLGAAPIHLDWRMRAEPATLRIESSLSTDRAVSLRIGGDQFANAQNGTAVRAHAGSHTVRLQQEGLRTFEMRADVHAGPQRLRLWSERATPLAAPRVATGIALVLAAGFTVVASIMASNLYDQFSRTPTLALANESDTWVSLADAGYIASGALALGFLTVLLWPDPEPELRARLSDDEAP